MLAAGPDADTNFNAENHERTYMDFDATALARYEADLWTTYEGGYSMKTRCAKPLRALRLVDQPHGGHDERLGWGRQHVRWQYQTSSQRRPTR